MNNFWPNYSIEREKSFSKEMEEKAVNLSYELCILSDQPLEHKTYAEYILSPISFFHIYCCDQFFIRIS